MHTFAHLHRRCAVTILTLLAAAPGLQAQLGLGLSPLREELRAQAGTQHSGTLAVTNDSSGPLRIRAEMLDFYLDAEATPQFSRRFTQEAAYSCRDWISINPVEWEQASGTIQNVRFTVRIPANAAQQSYHCGLGFTALPAAAEAKGMGLRMTVRAVSALYVFVGTQPAPQGALKSIAIEAVTAPARQGWRAVVLVENPSATVLRPAGQLEVLDSQGKVIEAHELTSVPVLPKREQRLLVPLEHVGANDRFTLRARVDVGTGEIQEGETVVVARAPNP